MDSILYKNEFSSIKERLFHLFFTFGVFPLSTPYSNHADRETAFHCKGVAMLESAMPAAVAALRLKDPEFDALCQEHQRLDDEIDGGKLEGVTLRRAKIARLYARQKAEKYFMAGIFTAALEAA